MKEKTIFNAASFFCGCGGIDLGLQGGFAYLGRHYERLDYNIVYASDFDKYALEIYKSNFSHSPILKDIKLVHSSEVPAIDILLGGFPCQSFSISAQNPPRLGYKDERGMLFFEMARIIKEKAPRVFIAENVKGIISANKGQALPAIIRTFQSIGYHVKYKLLDASHYGIPQKRQRVFIIGFKELDDFNKFQFPVATTKDSPVALKEVLNENENKNEELYFSQNAVNGMMKVKHKMNKGRDQNLDLPCNTISAHLAKVSLNSTDPVLKINGRYRRFSPREAARIQSFPDSFLLEGIVSQSRQYKAIGNAVPPVLMWHIAKELECVFKNENSPNLGAYMQPRLI